MARRRPSRRSAPSGARQYPRTARLNQVLHEVVAEVIEGYSQEDERLELLTVTGVEVDSDLRHATVFYSAHHERADEALEEHRIRLQAEINRQTRMRRTPQLSFEVDTGVETGWRIEEILQKLRDDDEDEGRDQG